MVFLGLKKRQWEKPLQLRSRHGQYYCESSVGRNSPSLQYHSVGTWSSKGTGSKRFWLSGWGRTAPQIRSDDWGCCWCTFLNCARRQHLPQTLYLREETAPRGSASWKCWGQGAIVRKWTRSQEISPPWVLVHRPQVWTLLSISWHPREAAVSTIAFGHGEYWFWICILLEMPARNWLVFWMWWL